MIFDESTKYDGSSIRDSAREVQLVFAPRGGSLEKPKFGVKEFSAKIDKTRNWFKDYRISSIELWIQVAVREIKQNKGHHYNQKPFDF